LFDAVSGAGVELISAADSNNKNNNKNKSSNHDSMSPQATLEPTISSPHFVAADSTSITIPFIAETHVVNRPAEKVGFSYEKENLRFDLHTLAATTKAITIALPRNTYRFEGQFHQCTVSTYQTQARIVENGSFWQMRRVLTLMDNLLVLWSPSLSLLRRIIPRRYLLPFSVSLRRHQSQKS
jgi:hypothetical protein